MGHYSSHFKDDSEHTRIKYSFSIRYESILTGGNPGQTTWKGKSLLVRLDILRRLGQSTTPGATEGTGSEKIAWWHEDRPGSLLWEWCPALEGHVWHYRILSREERHDTTSLLGNRCGCSVEHELWGHNEELGW